MGGPSTSRRRWALLAVALLAIGAGCGGVASDRPTTDASTLTPAPVPTLQNDYAPGVGDDGVNVSAVVAGHERRLVNTSYTLERTLSVRSKRMDAVHYREVTLTRVAAGGTPFSLATAYSEPRHFDGLVSSHLYYDGSTKRRSRYADRNVSYATFDRRTNVDLRAVGLLRRVLYQLDNLSVRRTGDGRTVVSGEVRHPRTLPTPPSVRTTGRATVSMRIADSGVVDRLAVGYDAQHDGEPVRVRFATRVSRIDRTTVTRPDWLNRTNASGSTPTD